MNLKILKNKEIIENLNLKEFHAKNNIFIQHDPKFCFFNTSKNSESITFLLLDNEKIIACANLSHFNDGKINILTNIPSTSSHSSFLICKKTKYKEKEVIRKLYLEIKNYCLNHKIELFSFATDPFEQNISEYDHIIKPELKFRNFLQIIDLSQYNMKLKTKNLQIKYEKLNKQNLEDFYSKYSILFKKKGYNIFDFESFEFLTYLDSYIYYVFKNNELLNSTIIIKNNNILVEYYLSINFNNKFRSNDFLNQHLCEKFKKANFKFFNFQSSKKINDGTFLYKKKYQPDLKYFFYLTKLFIDKESFINKCHLYVAKDNRFVYPEYFKIIKNYNISYIK
jgi:hypothetical protein